MLCSINKVVVIPFFNVNLLHVIGPAEVPLNIDTHYNLHMPVLQHPKKI